MNDSTHGGFNDVELLVAVPMASDETRCPWVGPFSALPCGSVMVAAASAQSPSCSWSRFFILMP